MDILYIVITVAFFVVSTSFARGCDKLLKEEEDQDA